MDTPGKNKKVLLVDDEEMIREMTREILTYLGYEVISATNGSEAVQLFSQGKDDFDLVIIDLIMPKMNGAVCLEKIKAIKNEVPVIISSGITEVSKKEAMLSLGAAAYVEKPYTIESLQQTLQSI